MKPSFSAPRRIGRIRGRRTKAVAPLRPIVFDRVLTLHAVDRGLSWLLLHPRALQRAGILIGLLLAALALYPLVIPAQRPAAPFTSPAAAPAQPALPTTPDAGEQEILAVVAAYNQASITAAVLNTADPTALYLAPEGSAWAEVQAEYQRRARKGETHDPALSRWGVLKVAVDGDAAVVETQEQWDDVTIVGGQVVSSKRGVLTRNRYVLRRSPSQRRWLITGVTSSQVIG